MSASSQTPQKDPCLSQVTHEKPEEFLLGGRGRRRVGIAQHLKNIFRVYLCKAGRSLPGRSLPTVWKEAGKRTEVSFVLAFGQSLPSFSPPQPTPLFNTPSHLLDTFIKDFLQPDETFLNQIKKAVDIICTFLKENCFRHSSTKVLKTVKVNSSP